MLALDVSPGFGRENGTESRRDSSRKAATRLQPTPQSVGRKKKGERVP